ncbi:hypothetical protein H0O02_00640 [Candidatus Micrarchaeota archaeon]|nr:hypothetical protein [Candidatus Micrarchaeota archaeon]
MDWKKIALMVFIIVGVFIAAGALLYFSGVVAVTEEAQPETRFNVIEMGNAGNYGYAVYDFAGEGNVTLISYRKEAAREITIIQDDEGIEMERMEEFTELLTPLEKYGYKIKMSDRRVLGDGIYVVPTGAMPTYVLDDITNNATDGVVVYLGKKNFLLRGGMQEQNWYDELTPQQKDRILIYDKTLKEYMEGGDYSIVQDIIENKWSSVAKATYAVKGEGRKTGKVNLQDGRYVRIIYDLGSRKGITDSIALMPVSNVLLPDPENKYPHQDSILIFHLNETDGIAYFTAYRDGTEVQSKKLSRVTNGSVFRETLEFEKPGEYILRVVDNNGPMASGILHVNDIEIEQAGRSGYNNYFLVTVDGIPLRSGEVEARLGNSTASKKFYVADGELTIGAKLQQGENVFVMEINGEAVPVTVMYAQENIFDVYIKYGIPGLLLVALIYAGARFSRRPTYMLRATEGSREIRKEVKITTNDLVRAFGNIREDMKIGKSPITAQEFEMAVKRYITKGADITDGNIEEMLKALVSKGMIEGHRQYYQFAGEGNIKERTLLRMIREKLIENGIQFRTAGNRFVTKDCDIGLFGEKFENKAVIVVDDENEIKRIIDGLSPDEKAKIRIKEANGMMAFVPIDRLGEIL